MISGIIASPGVAFGKALLLEEENIIVNKKKILHKEIENEINRFYIARKKSLKQLKKIQIKTKKNLGKKKEEIFESHILLLEDIELEKEVLYLIKKKNFSAELSIKKIINNQIKSLKKIKDEYLRNRIIDIQDIGKRLLKNILNINTSRLKNISQKSILIAQDLTPSETAQINLKNIIGFITEIGSKTSHTSIMARSLEIPAIVGTKNITKIVKNEDFIILNGLTNNIIINPSIKEIKKFKKLQKKYLKNKKKLMSLKNLPTITKDGTKIEIGANIGNCEDVSRAKKYGAECIGLYRTEFLFMDRNNLPSEEEQYKAYKLVTKKVNNGYVIIRTMDIGGDKNLSYMKFPKEENPFLGWRAIRVSIDRIEILNNQLKAILRASAFGKVKILFPMIISLEEVLFLKKKIKILKKELSSKNIKFDKKIEIGVMIETPSSALIAKNLAKEVDFFSIGTNDLTQYTLAVDRGNDLISHLYNPLHPAVLKLIKKVINASHKEGKWTSICGELAGEKKSTALLLGLKIDKLSMNPSSIPYIKQIIRKSNFKKAKELAKKVLNESSSKKILKLIKKFNDRLKIF
ncbi:phosphoenolpyruvate-protein phosphotransferase PtsI [Buchnera aphidicola]|uniref:phosphoenolpyruvate-protein phosphotransferase PtsI n=1 Tax=Buchnera aphidicola TaxID=9 RepID=UPI0030EF53DE